MTEAASGGLAIAALDSELDQFPGTVSVWFGPVDGAAIYQRHAEVGHYPASTMKLAVLAAAYRLADRGVLDLDEQVTVHNRFRSAAPGAPEFTMDPEYDSDPEVWARLGGKASLRWLAERMIILSSNLATNLVLERTGYDAATAAFTAAGATGSVVRRGIEDYAARDAGMDNRVTAADLAALLGAIAEHRIASPEACREMHGILLAQRKNDDLPAGLPPGTPVAHKNGWVDGIRHDAGIVHSPDAPPYRLVVCISATKPDEATEADYAALDATMRDLMRRIAQASWDDRHRLAG